MKEMVSQIGLHLSVSFVTLHDLWIHESGDTGSLPCHWWDLGANHS